MLNKQKHWEAICLEAFDPPVVIERPDNWTAPVIFASPHSGSVYPDAFLKRSTLNLIEIRRNEDAFINELFAPVTNLGAPLLHARFPRCFLDVNRAEDELPKKWRTTPGKSTLRADMGLGIVPTMIAEKRPIYKRGLKSYMIEPRIDALYYPYHNALRTLIDTARDKFGWALLVDCHSMPGFLATGKHRADIILGDRYGTSCCADTSQAIEEMFKGRGYTVARNHPYAGSHATSHYGQPHEGVEAIQIEINRDLYLDPASITPTDGYDSLARDLVAISDDLIKYAKSPVAQAAE